MTSHVRAIAASLCVVVLTGVRVLADEKKADKFDPEKLVGTWKYTAGEKDGSKVEEDRLKDQTVIITKEKWTLKGGETFVMTYEIDAKKSPATIKLTMTESPFGAGAVAMGVVELKDDTLKLCYAPMGGDAPTKFEAKQGSGFHLFTLKRSK